MYSLLTSANIANLVTLSTQKRGLCQTKVWYELAWSDFEQIRFGSIRLSFVK